MPEHPRADERAPEPFEELRRDAPVFEVAPIKARTRVPVIALVAIVIGVAAFVAGIGVASAGPAPRPGRSAGPASAAGPPGPGAPGIAVSPAADATAGSSVTGTAAPAGGSTQPGGPSPTGAGPDAAAPTPASSLLPAGSSEFAISFDPAAIVAAARGGDRCTTGEPRDKEVPRTRRDGPRLTFQRSWLIWCTVPAERRQPFLLDVFEAMVKAVPADTYGYNAGVEGGGDALFPYAEPPLAGTVAVTADAAGTGFVVAIVLEEWRSDQVR